MQHARRSVRVDDGPARNDTHCPMNLPPSQCCPPFSAHDRTPTLGAVREINASARNKDEPYVVEMSTIGHVHGSKVWSTLPSLTDHPEGMSTERMGFVVAFNSVKTSVKGALEGDLYENPVRDLGMSTYHYRQSPRRRLTKDRVQYHVSRPQSSLERSQLCIGRHGK